MTTTTTNPHPSYESVLPAARQYVSRGGLFSAEDVAHRAYDDGVAIMHAAHVLYGEAIEDGRIPTDRCSHCTGRNRAGAGDHNLCAARAERGLPTPILDGSQAPCSCWPCALERVER